MRSLGIGLVLVFAACGGGVAVPRGRAVHAAQERSIGPDAAVELAARLPRGADSCAVARTGALSALRRTLYRRLSHGDPVAFLPDAPFVAVATALRVLPNRRRVQVVLVRTSAGPDFVRSFLDERSGLRLDWSTGAAPRSGVVRARFLDEHTVELVNGRFPESSVAGVGIRCAELAATNPLAIEVASRRGESLFVGGLGPDLERIEFLVSTTDHRLRIERTTTLGGDDSGFDARAIPGLDGPGFGRLPAAVLADSVEESVDGRQLRHAMSFRWEDLALALEDEGRALAGVLADAATHQAQPADSFDVSDLEAVRVQRELWRARADAFGAPGIDARRQLRVLLERAIGAHPQEADLRRDLFELFVRGLGDAPAAARVAADAIRDGVGDAAEFAQLRREALAHGDVRGLADALASDGVVPPRLASDAAVALAAAVLEGADYSFAEAAYIAGRALIGRPYRAAARRVAPTTLDLEAIPDALAVLVEAADVSGSLWIAVEGTRPTWGIEAFDSERAPRIALDVGRDLLLGAANTASAVRLAALGESLAGALEPGPVVISFFVVPFGGTAARPSAWGRLEGDLVDGRLALERVAGPGARMPWDRVRRYLTEPLAASRARRFPPPTVIIEAESTADAEALVALDDAHPGVRCERDERALVCTPAPSTPEALRALLMDFTAQRLRALSSALLVRPGRR